MPPTGDSIHLPLRFLHQHRLVPGRPGQDGGLSNPRQHAARPARETLDWGMPPASRAPSREKTWRPSRQLSRPLALRVIVSEPSKILKTLLRTSPALLQLSGHGTYRTPWTFWSCLGFANAGIDHTDYSSCLVDKSLSQEVPERWREGVLGSWNWTRRAHGEQRDWLMEHGSDTGGIIGDASIHKQFVIVQNHIISCDKM